jgi:hypothetical protein
VLYFHIRVFAGPSFLAENEQNGKRKTSLMHSPDMNTNIAYDVNKSSQQKHTSHIRHNQPSKKMEQPVHVPVRIAVRASLLRKRPCVHVSLRVRIRLYVHWDLLKFHAHVYIVSCALHSRACERLNMRYVLGVDKLCACVRPTSAACVGSIV